MSPITHLLASWLIAAKAMDNSRDCRLVTLAGLAPDLDGLGLISDIVTHFTSSSPTTFYQTYHHYAFHGLLAALIVSVSAALLARNRLRVFLFALLVFHLHLLCDLIGSRGPDPEDLWPCVQRPLTAPDPHWIASEGTKVKNRPKIFRVGTARANQIAKQIGRQHV